MDQIRFFNVVLQINTQNLPARAPRKSYLLERDLEGIDIASKKVTKAQQAEKEFLAKTRNNCTEYLKNKTFVPIAEGFTPCSMA